jgi:hypothetical protein
MYIFLLVNTKGEIGGDGRERGRGIATQPLFKKTTP